MTSRHRACCAKARFGGLIDRVDDDAAGADDDDVLDSDTDLLEDALMEAGLDADLDDDSGRQGVEDGNA